MRTASSCSAKERSPVSSILATPLPGRSQRPRCRKIRRRQTGLEGIATFREHDGICRAANSAYWRLWWCFRQTRSNKTAANSIPPTSDGFFSANNLGELLANTSIWTILGLAAAIVILAGGIDISIGSLLALAAVSAGIVLKLPMPSSATVPLAVLVACLVGTAGGLVNGAVSLLGRVHPIVVTLGMMIVYRGAVIALRSANEINTLPESFGWLAIHPPSGFHGSIVFGVLVATAAHVWLRHTPSGRNLFALGASPTAARLVGISRIRTSLLSFSIGGLLAGIAAIVVLARSNQMQATLGTGWELQAIAVAVIGGVSITGGRGTVFGVGLGAVLLQLVKAALVRWQIPGDRVDVVVGGILLAAVLFDLVWRKRDV